MVMLNNSDVKADMFEVFGSFQSYIACTDHDSPFNVFIKRGLDSIHVFNVSERENLWIFNAG